MEESEEDSFNDLSFGRFSFGKNEAGYVADDSISELSRNLTHTSEFNPRILKKKHSMTSVISQEH